MTSIVPRTPNAQGESKWAILGNTETGITARAGGGQTNAYALTAQMSVIATAASTGDSVRLPKVTGAPSMLGSTNSMMVVSNQSAHSVQVFGATPDKIDGVATSTGVTLLAGQSATFFATAYNQSSTVGEWVSTIPAAGSGIAVGAAISGSAANELLYTSSGNVLAQSADLGVVHVANTLTALNLAMGTQSISLGMLNAGDAYIAIADAAAGTFAIGADNSAANFALSKSGAIGTNNVWTADGTTFEIVDILKINNTVTSSVATPSTHKVAINIGGTPYFLLATT